MNSTLKRKYIACFLAILVIVLSFVLYCKPAQLSEIFIAYTDIRYIYMELGMKDGNAHIDDSGLLTLSGDECKQLNSIVSKHTYSRDISTLFLGDSMSGLGNEVVYIYTYQNDVLTNCVLISSSGKVSINDKIYSLSNSDELVHEITEMMSA